MSFLIIETELSIFSENVKKNLQLFQCNRQNAVFWIPEKTDNCRNDSRWFFFNKQFKATFCEDSKHV